MARSARRNFGQPPSAPRLLRPSVFAMGRSARLVCLFVMLAAPAAAQSTTEDGIRAMLRGDYQAAAHILRPLADDVTRPDPVARFFLAFLYNIGRGVRFDQFRACGLFLGAGTHPNPFAEQSASIAALMQEQLGGPGLPFCVADEAWYGKPPQAFVLGPGHRIVFADTSITLDYGDKGWRTPLKMPPGAVFLPIQHTVLAVTRPVVVSRHFFQWFGWVPKPLGNPSSWSLQWALSEVVGDQWIPVASETSLTVVERPAPPASYDVSSLVGLRINAAGEAEYTVMGGSSPRTEAIPWKGSR
jgi:hypothetical protein